LLGHTSSLLGQSDLAVHAHVIVRMLDFRFVHRGLVSVRCADNISVGKKLAAPCCRRFCREFRFKTRDKFEADYCDESKQALRP